MAISFCNEWFLDLFNLDVSNKDVPTILTDLGIESTLTDLSSLCDSKVVVAEVISTSAHPDADRLKVCEVDTGAERITIVCGCPSVAPGMKVPAALHGAKLPKLKIKRSKIRGVASEGMLCSALDLGWCCYSSGLLLLPNHFTVGDSLYRSLNIFPHGVESEITPNRGDCLSLLGIAREFAAKTNQSITLPPTESISPSKFNNFIIDTPLCEAYAGVILSNIKNTEPPAWLLAKSYVLGLHSVSPLVDILAYATHECGQPFHAFDLDLIQLPLIVKEAEVRSNFTGIQGQDISVELGDIVILDQTGSVKALAGIMGSLDSAVSDSTTHAFIEAAHFNSVTIAKTLRRINITTDSAFRFERATDSQNIGYCTERLIHLLKETFKCECDYYNFNNSNIKPKTTIQLTRDYISRILGCDFSNKTIEFIFTSLNFDWSYNNQVWSVIPPSYRNDLAIPVDLLEEILRFNGYNQLESEANEFIKIPYSSVLNESMQNDLPERLVSMGYNEIVSYAFISQSSFNLFSDNESIKLTNPMSEELAVMRDSLWPSLLLVAKRNLVRQQAFLRIFEFSRVFHGCEPGSQPRTISGLISGSLNDDNWMKGSHPLCDFFQIKRDVECLLKHINPSHISWVSAEIKGLQPGVSAYIKIKDKIIGKCGMLSAELMCDLNINEPIGLFDINESILTDHANNSSIAIPSDYPSVRRDITFDVPKHVTYDQIQAVIKKNNNIFLKFNKLFDIYHSDDFNRKDVRSLSIGMIFNHSERTLKDDTVNRYRDKLITDLQTELNITVRGIHDHNTNEG